MRNEQFQLYTDLVGLELSPEILKLIPFKVRSVARFCKNSFVINSSRQQSLMVWLHQGREENLAVQARIIKYCNEKGFNGFLDIIPLKDDRMYGKLDERRWFYLTEYTGFEKLSYHNLNHLKSVVNLIVCFRHAINDLKNLSGFTAGYKERYSLLEKMEEIPQYFEAFGMLAKYRLSSTKFDWLFLDLLPLLRDKSIEAVEKLRSSDYIRMRSEMDERSIIINDFARNNLRIGARANAICLRIKNLRWDLPILDLAVLLSKSGRSNKWSNQWFNCLVEEYQKEFAITDGEMKIVEAYLTFPWSMYRLTSRYYLNRVDWPQYLFVEKLERLIADEVNQSKFIKNFS